MLKFHSLSKRRGIVRLLAPVLGLSVLASTVNFACAASAKPTSSAKAVSGSFANFLESLWPDAQAAGISRSTFDRALKGLSPDPNVAALTRKQAEFIKPVWSYMTGAVTADRIARGRSMAGQWSDTLSRAESSFGVPSSIILGIWGMETNYGSFTGSMDVFRSLATLAHLKYRGTFFRDELIQALLILERRQASREAMLGSWAGAMGHTQFMPSSFIKHAVDFDGDGRRDIWSSVPDALGSTAAYLKNHGWVAGLPWGVEVIIPPGFDFRTNRDSFIGWANRGFTRADGGAMPRGGEATLLLLAGAKGPAFLVTTNYDVIKKYNNSDAYALAVAHLGDRIAGRAPIVGKWPTGTRILSVAERKEVQTRLKSLGHYTGEVDGRLGTASREAVRNFQLKAGYFPADGYADAALLARLRKGK